MAELFVAEPMEGGRRVALKMIREHLRDVPRYVEMFLDEARVLKCIDHPNVVSVDALEKDGDDYFMVMEYVDGVSLGSLMDGAFRKDRSIDVDVAVRIITKALDGLEAAHEATGHEGRRLDVVHRDISPQNILVGRDGRVKVIDFGIAKAHGRLHHTKNGNIKGKLRYMSPEHCGGSPVDHRSDLYALAVVLWEMLTLRPYFDGENELEIVRQVRLPTFRSISVWNERVTADLEEVVRKALHPEPKRRFQSARELRKALLAACPKARTVGPAHVAAFVSRQTSGPSEPWSAANTSQHSARYRAVAGYTFHVVVPAGGHEEDVPETKILDGTERRAAVRRSSYGFMRRRPHPALGWLLAAAMFVFFMSGVTGVAMGHALADRGADAPAAKLTQTKWATWR
jgi:serine/threonine-protein kinase